MLVDLHTHSTSSDGTYTPAKLVEAAAAAKIGVLALTDHDSVNGIVQAEAAAVNIKNAPRIIRGVELGTQAGEASVHILGYHIDISNERLLTKMHEMRHARELRLQKILKKIAENDDLTMIYISHSPGMIKKLCDSIAIMSKGKLAELESVEEFFKSPKSVEGLKFLRASKELMSQGEYKGDQ